MICRFGVCNVYPFTFREYYSAFSRPLCKNRSNEDITPPEVLVGNVIVLRTSVTIEIEGTYERQSVSGIFIGKSIVVREPSVSLLYER